MLDYVFLHFIFIYLLFMYFYITYFFLLNNKKYIYYLVIEGALRNLSFNFIYF